MIARLLYYVIVVYGLTLIAAYLLQRQLQYFPNKKSPGTPAQNNLPEMREIRVTTDDRCENIAWFAPPRSPSGRVAVFFHGNAGHMGDRAIKARYFIEKGHGVLFCEYRGYGGNKGSPCEQGFYKDARACLKWLEAQGYTNAQIVLYGESIGSGVAVQMAFETQPPLLILEAPFTSAVDVAKTAYFFLPVDMLMKDRFDNLEKIAAIKSQLLIVHGDEDETIPVSLAEKLFSAANHPKEFITINGGHHNDLYEHHAGHVITDWLGKKVWDAAG